MGKMANLSGPVQMGITFYVTRNVTVTVTAMTSVWAAVEKIGLSKCLISCFLYVIFLSSRCVSNCCPIPKATTSHKMCNLNQGDRMLADEISNMCCQPGYISLLDSTSSKEFPVTCKQTDEGAIATSLHNTKPHCTRGRKNHRKCHSMPDH